MKNLILGLSLLITSTHFAFAQIPNSGFETWTNMGSYFNPESWATLNNSTSIMGVYTATKGTPGSPGSSYLKLTSKTVSSSTVNGIAVCGTLDSTTMLPKGGFPMNSRPLNLTGKWQHMIFGSSQGSISVYLTRWDSGTNSQIAVASGSVTLSGMAMSWANFSIPLIYSDGGNPDSCIIFLKASGNNPTNNDYLWVDNLSFTGTVTGVSSLNPDDHFLSVKDEDGILNLTVQSKVAEKVQIEILNVNGQLLYRTSAKTDGDGHLSLDIPQLKANQQMLFISVHAGNKMTSTTYFKN